MKNIQQQIEAWGRLYGRPVSEEEVKEIAFNLNGFFNTLKELADDEERIKQDDGNQTIRNTNHAG